MQAAIRARAVLFAVLAVTATSVLPAPADAVITACNRSPALAATLSVAEANGTTVTADGTGYMACVFPNGSEAYSIVIAQADGIEDLGTANATRVFTLGFTLPDGASATSAELYAGVRSYVIGPNGRDITLVLTPVATTSAGPDLVPLQDSIARITGGIRFTPSGAPSHGFVGMWIGASASSYRVTMGGSCPNYGTGGASGSAEGGSISVVMEAPHLTAGTLGPPVLNTGALQAFIPEATASACFGGATLAQIVTALQITRSETAEGSTTLTPGTQFTVAAGVGGLLIDVPRVTFSRPTYRFSAPSLATTARAVATRVGNKAKVVVTVPASSAGKPLVIAVKVRGRFVTRSSTKAKPGTVTRMVSLKGVKGVATVRVTLGGAAISTIRL
ncbi:MAG: hypothetical protein ACKO7U_06265 [Actinomycetota bacterium]